MLYVRIKESPLHVNKISICVNRAMCVKILFIFYFQPISNNFSMYVCMYTSPQTFVFILDR